MSRARTHRGRAKTNAGKRTQSVAPTERVDKQPAESVPDDQLVAEVVCRIVAAVADCPPVVAAGRTFPARVAGASPGPLSFSQPMRDATHAELTVQP